MSGPQLRDAWGKDDSPGTTGGGSGVRWARQQAIQFAADIVNTGGQDVAPRDQDDPASGTVRSARTRREASLHRVAPQRFAQQSFRTVALDRFADLAACHDTPCVVFGRQQIQNKQAPDALVALRVDLREFPCRAERTHYAGRACIRR